MAAVALATELWDFTNSSASTCINSDLGTRDERYVSYLAVRNCTHAEILIILLADYAYSYIIHELPI